MKIKNLLIAMIVVATLVGYALTFTVEEGKYGVLTIMGKASDHVYHPGLYFKPPWPFAEVVKINGKSHLFKGNDEQVITRDQNSYIVRSHVMWRVKPEGVIHFWKKINNESEFNVQLSGLLRSHQNGVIGNKTQDDLFPKGDAAQGLVTLEQEMLKKLKGACEEGEDNYGVEIQLVGFNKLTLTENVLEKVFEKMSAERNKVSEKFKAEGESEARKIKAEKRAEVDQAMAKVEGEVSRILGKAEADSMEAYQILAENPELSLKLKKIETLESMLKDRSTIILDSDTPPIDLLRPEKGK